MISILRKCIDEGFLAGVSLGALTLVNALRIDNRMHLAPAIFSFLSGFASYLFIKHFGNGKRLKKRYMCLSVLALAGGVLSAFYLSFWSLAIALFCGFLSWSYVARVAPFRKPLRACGGWIKISAVVLCWTLMSVGVVFVESGRQADMNVWLYGIKIVFLVMALIIPFEIRDSPGDAVKTLPASIGLAACRRVGICAAIGFYGIRPSNPSDLIVAGFLIYAIARCRPGASYWLVGFWVEAVPVFWLALSV